MSKFDDLFGNLATNLIDNTFGTAATYTREASTYDPVTGQNNVTATTYQIQISPPAPVKKRRQEDGTRFENQDVQFYLARQGLPIEPSSATDYITFRGSRYQIVMAEPLVSGDEIAAWLITARK